VIKAKTTAIVDQLDDDRLADDVFGRLVKRARYFLSQFIPLSRATAKAIDDRPAITDLLDAIVIFLAYVLLALTVGASFAHCTLLLSPRGDPYEKGNLHSIEPDARSAPSGPPN
jgi:hypothetical protein